MPEWLGRNMYCPACGVRMTAKPLQVEAALRERERSAAGGRGSAIQRLPLVALVDNVRSLWNVGSIFRTADACGIREIVLAGISGCPPRPEITKTALGAEVTLVDGLITDCGRESRAGAEAHGWFDVSTLKEPYRLEGKKTMGYELAEQFGWQLPDVIIYPTGGGTGLIGMWKAFDELEQLGWIEGGRPRMVAVQPEGCAPIPRAFHSGEEFAAPWEDASTVAAGLRVPSAVGDFMMLRTLRESNGTAVAVSDEEMMEASNAIGRAEGIFICPEGGATLAAFRRLRQQSWIRDDETVVLFNTGSGLKYVHLWDKA